MSRCLSTAPRLTLDFFKTSVRKDALNFFVKKHLHPKAEAPHNSAVYTN
jgi:hypothetical protein